MSSLATAAAARVVYHVVSVEYTPLLSVGKSWPQFYSLKTVQYCMKPLLICTVLTFGKESI